MIKKIGHLISAMILLLFVSCTEQVREADANGEDFEAEKAAILGVLHGETKAAFERDYSDWKTHWVQADYVTKTYLNFSDSTMTETLGWKEIDGFVKDYIDAHPEPDPLPTLVDEIDVRLYGDAAWVSYEQQDTERGRKRETRLMEKEDGQWKIAGMHTTIYGFEHEQE